MLERQADTEEHEAVKTHEPGASAHELKRNPQEEGASAPVLQPSNTDELTVRATATSDSVSASQLLTESNSRPRASIGSLDKDGKYEISFRIGGALLFSCEVSSESKSLAAATIKLLRERLELPEVTTSEVAVALQELFRSSGVKVHFPAHQFTGDLWLTLNDWLPSGLKSQLFPGSILGHPGCKDAPFSVAQSIAAQLTGGDAAYFIARGRSSNEVIGVQLVKGRSGDITVFALSGIGESLLWPSLGNGANNWDVIVSFLKSVSGEQEQDLEILGSPILLSPWSHSIRRSTMLRTLGEFATSIESAWLGIPPHLLEVPVVLSPSDVNECGRDKLVARFQFKGNKSLAVLIAPDGIKELAVSDARRTLFGRNYWATIWKQHGTGASDSVALPEVGHLVKILQSLGDDVYQRGAKRLEFDGFRSSPAERMIEMLYDVKTFATDIFFRVFEKKVADRSSNSNPNWTGGLT